MGVCEKVKTFFQNLIFGFWKWIKSWTWKSWLKLILIIIFSAIIITISLVFRKQVIHYMGIVLDWIQKAGYKGMLVMVCIYALATVLFIPGLVLTLAAGFLWKYWGIPIISAGSTIGATLAFIIGRTLGRSMIEEQVKEYPKFNAIDEAIKLEGWKIVLLLRLIPLVPFNFLNYALAITNIDLITYALTSWIGMLPGTLLYIYIGISAGSIADIIAGRTNTSTWWVQLIVFGGTGILVVVGFIFIGFVARKYVKKYIKDNESTEQAVVQEDPVEYNSQNPESKIDEVQQKENEQTPLI